MAKEPVGDPFRIFKILVFSGDFLTGNQVKMCDFPSFSINSGPWKGWKGWDFLAKTQTWSPRERWGGGPQGAFLVL